MYTGDEIFAINPSDDSTAVKPTDSRPNCDQLQPESETDVTSSDDASDLLVSFLFHFSFSP